MTCCVVCGNEPPPDADGRCPFCGTLLPPAAAAVALSDQWHRTINLEAGRPQVLQALARLERQLVEARDQGCRVLTLIHGYGSSGSGGVIREAVRRQLRCWLDQGRIAAWLPGEDLSRRVVRQAPWRRYPLLERHDGLGRGNRGITLVMLAGSG